MTLSLYSAFQEVLFFAWFPLLFTGWVVFFCTTLFSLSWAFFGFSGRFSSFVSCDHGGIVAPNHVGRFLLSVSVDLFFILGCAPG